jgi:sec-independent protein translocase protein TatA
MFGNIGFPELLIILAIALLIFGPKKLPEVGRSIGKAVREFRRTSDEIKDRIEEEIRASEFKDIKEDLKKDFTFDKKEFGLDTKEAAPEVSQEAAPDISRDAAGGSEVKKNGEGQEIS